MSRFPQALRDIRELHEDLFDEPALHPPPPDDLVIPVISIDVPTPKERKEDIQPADEYEGILEQAGDIAIPSYEEPWAIEPDTDDFDTRERAIEERRDFENRRTQVGTELLAIYLPFHFYPEGTWGVRFFERPVLQFAKMVWRESRKRGLGHSQVYLLKVVVYSVARHEFTHYVTELFALQLELLQGRRFYRPYYDGVYKKTYPSADCIEETVADYWSLDNSVIRSPVSLGRLFRGLVRKGPPGYANAATYNDDTIRSVEDRLTSQVNQVVPKPRNIPPVWGQLPRPYVQPWTRYENVDWTMNLTAGGILGPILNAKPLRKTVSIYHR